MEYINIITLFKCHKILNKGYFKIILFTMTTFFLLVAFCMFGVYLDSR